MRDLSPAGERLRGSCRRGFTLIELLAVMTIILILAGLILAIAGNANYKGACARAQGEIQAMSTALESYKTDNGAYPESTPIGISKAGSDKLDPTSTVDQDPLGPDSATFIAAGRTLYQALAGINPVTGTGIGADGVTLSKVYMNFNPNQLGPSPTPTPSASNNKLIYVVDPFGMPYGYSTVNFYWTQAVAAGSPSPAPSPLPGYNPTFDLWSTAGYGTGGKSSPSPAPSPGVLWIKNW